MGQVSGYWKMGAIIAALMLSSAVWTQVTAAEDGLPCDNPRLPTEAEIGAGAPRGIKGCPEDFPTIAPDSGAAKQYLRNILCPPDRDNYGGYGPDETIRRLDVKFAVCAADFLRVARQNGIDVCIREGARTVAKQNEYVRRGVLACKKGPLCEHPRGIAIDVNTSNDTNYARLHKGATSFGLIFYLGFRDKYHFVPQKGGCFAGGTIPAGESIPPTFYDHPQYYTPPQQDISANPPQQQPSLQNPSEQKCTLPDGTQVPCSAIANRNNPQTTGAGGPTGSPIPPQNLPQNQQPFAQGTCAPQFYCANSTYYYRTSTCVDQVYQKCPAGCSTTGNACAATSTGGALSVFDQIGLLAEPTSTPAGSVGDMLLELAIGGEDIATIQDSRPTSTLPPGGSYIGPQAPPQQTFTSDDLRYSQAEYQEQRSTLLRILDTMKQMLMRALAYLRPFGRPAPEGVVYNEFGEVDE